MTTTHCRWPLLAFLILVSPPLLGQAVYSEHTLKLDVDAKGAAATIEDVAFISGHWATEIWGGVAEENWSAPLGDNMMASFRMVKDDKVSFFEILSILEQDETLVLRLKHFHANLRGWEEKDETIDFRLVKLEKNKAYFDGITFHRKDTDHLDVFLVTGEKDGAVQEATFHYRRQSS